MKLMTLEEHARRDNVLMSGLKLSKISHYICGTDKGDLTLNLWKGGTAAQYWFALDSVPVDNEKNEQLMGYVEGSFFESTLVFKTTGPIDMTRMPDLTDGMVITQNTTEHGAESDTGKAQEAETNA